MCGCVVCLYICFTHGSMYYNFLKDLSCENEIIYIMD